MEDLCAEETEGSSDQYYGDDESSSGYVSSERSEISGDGTSCTTEESVDNNLCMLIGKIWIWMIAITLILFYKFVFMFGYLLFFLFTF